MRSLRKLDHALYVGLVWFALAVTGWSLRSAPLAIIGVLGALTTGAMYLWQRECLVGVTYSHRLSQTRAMFDERVTLEIEIVNDKLLPLSWLRAEEDVPSALSIEGGDIISGRDYVNTLVHVLPMLPYQRARRRLTVVCNRRGEHTFGPALVSSGDPIGLRARSGLVSDRQYLLVYPKVFALAPTSVVSWVLIGEVRSRFELLEDPSRAAGVREYRAGDPLRYVDWRATARRTALLVRQFEPSVSLRVALFVDFRVPYVNAWSFEAPELEFAVAVAASIISELTQRKVATGLFSSGEISGKPLAYLPSASPGALPTMLEALARATPFGKVRFAEVLSAESGRLQRGTSVLVVAADFPEATMLGITELRRRHAVTAVWVETERGSPPPLGLVDGLLSVRYSDDWQRREVLELAS
jgi:uncharacterized protein (DUF58 family)